MISAPRTSTSAPATMSPGSPTANGPTSAWRAAPLATCPSTWNSSWKCGIHQTPPAWSIDAIRCAALAKDHGVVWRAARAFRLLHEVPRCAIHRSTGAPARRAVHQRVWSEARPSMPPTATRRPPRSASCPPSKNRPHPLPPLHLRIGEGGACYSPRMSNK